MADTTFVDYSQNTPIVAAWLNDVNDVTYHQLPNLYSNLGVTKAQLDGNTVAPGQIAAAIGAFGIATSVSRVRRLTGTVSPQVYALGWAVPGDGGGGPYVANTSDTTSGAYFKGHLSGNTLIIDSVNNGLPAVGQVIDGVGVAARTYLVALTSGTGGAGSTFTTSGAAQTVASTQMTGDNGGTVLVGLDGTRWDLLRDSTVSVKQFGAIGDGATDNTNAIKAAHGTNLLIFYPAGTYMCSPFSMLEGGIVGEGPGQSIIEFTDTTSANLITYLGADGGIGPHTPLFRDFQIEGTLSKTVGAALYVAPTTGELCYADITNVTTLNVPTGIDMEAASGWKVDRCNLINYLNAGFNIANTNNNDSGDSMVSNCTLNTGLSTGGQLLGFQYQSSGGLKVVNCKVLGGLYGFVLAYSGTTNSSDLFIDNCSFEGLGTTGAGIFLGRASGSQTFSRICISNCELGFGDGIVTDASAAIHMLSIDNCDIVAGRATGTSYGLLLQGVVNLNVGQNILEAVSTGAIGVDISSTCQNGHVAPQLLIGFAAGQGLSNGSSSVTVEGRKQTVVGQITCSNTYGAALFEGALALNYAFAFNTVIRHSARVTSSANGAVNAYSIGATSGTITMVGLSATNGGVINVLGEVEGW